jgi:hypothetical protein
MPKVIVFGEDYAHEVVLCTLLFRRGAALLPDPCHLVWQVKQFPRLTGRGAAPLLDPCHLGGR